MTEEAETAARVAAQLTGVLYTPRRIGQNAWAAFTSDGQRASMPMKNEQDAESWCDRANEVWRRQRPVSMKPRP